MSKNVLLTGGHSVWAWAEIDTRVGVSVAHEMPFCWWEAAA